MTQNQIDALYDVARTSRYIKEVEYHSWNCAPKIRFVDNGGNEFYRSYDVLGNFLELEV